VRHIDPIGTVLVPALILLASSGGLLFGWAKPVPVNFGRLNRPKQDMLWVAAAGPGANLIMAIGWGLLLKLAISQPEFAYAEAMAAMAKAGIQINGVLMLLNLLPLPPLDGGRIAVSLLPPALAWRFAQIERFGLPILLVLLFTNMLDGILRPLLKLFYSFISVLFGF
jgi:Zn-dependent protease